MRPLSRVLLGIAASLSVYVSVSAVPTTESSQVAAQATKLPAAPSGYEWYVSKNGVGTFLKPNGWFIQEESKKKHECAFHLEARLRRIGTI